MIEVSGLRFTYPGQKTPVLKGINFSIQKGEIFGFLGPSGAGKSTIQKILIGILKQYEGRVSVMGKELNQAGSSFYEKIGVAFEFPNFYQRLTALENLSLFRALYASETEEPEALLALTGLEDYGRTKVSAYSKGMKMRLNFSRALINQPDLLFLDEPTSGLDPVHAKKLKQLILNKKAEGKTILITTHHMQTAEEICDRVAFIVDGKVALIDSPRALKVQKGKKHVKVEYRSHRQLETAQFDLDQIGSSPEFLNLIKEHPVETIHSQEASLEDIFIEVTGRRLS
ncbi:ABC transporter ATP-binding protein [Bacillus haynesii]|uniref:ABC transporter ATP-binding protein n=1 Tax=Bacillus haynesii TaxID=1925021 RepID=UPI00227EE0CE|nr:ABC transporter ATP-binding protein [Bacillus haynesii]MCY8142060.1 ABC transporter ATP-binding protein [Bacillus haynesii]